MTVLLQIFAPVLLNLPFTLAQAWETVTSARLAARLEAIRAAGEPTTLADLAKTYPEPPPEKNAEPLYTAAFRILDDPEIQQWPANTLPIQGTRELPKADEDFPPDLLANVRDYLGECRAALAFLHNAAANEEFWFDLHLDLGAGKAADVYLPRLAKMRNGARHLALEAVERAESGRPDEAAEALWACLRLGHAVRRQPLLISALLRMTFDAIAISQVEWLASRTAFPPRSLEKLQTALRDEADPDMARRALLAERCVDISLFLKTFPKGEDWDFAMFGMEHTQLLKLVPPTYFKAELVQYLDVTNECLAALRKPYPQNLVEGARLGSDAAGKVPAFFPLSRMILPQVLHTCTQAQRHMARVETARVALAALRFKAERGRLPNTLEDLVPAFLDAVPLGPFDAKALRYRKDAAGFVVYAVGSDGKDHGGLTERGQDGQIPEIGFRVRWPKGRF